MKTSEHLQKALDLFGPNGENWTQGASGRTAKGYTTYANSEDACSWCATGAITRIGVPNGISGLAAYNYLSGLSGGFGVVEFNDRPTTMFEDVKRMFEQAIQAAKEEGN